MLPPGRDLASGLLRCYRVQLFGGDTHQRKQKAGWALTASPGGAAAASPGLDAARGMRRGGEGVPSLMPGQGGNPRSDRCDGGSAAFCRRWGTRLRRGRERHSGGDGGCWQGPRHCARRGGRSALETSCPGGCLLRHQLGSWGERARRRALNAHTCLLPRGRCLGARPRRWKALELGGQLSSKLFSPETASTAAAGKLPAAGDKPGGGGSDPRGRRDPSSLRLPAWPDPDPDPSPSPCPAATVPLPPLPRAPWG